MAGFDPLAQKIHPTNFHLMPFYFEAGYCHGRKGGFCLQLHLFSGLGFKSAVRVRFKVLDGDLDELKSVVR